ARRAVPPLSLHDALPVSPAAGVAPPPARLTNLISPAGRARRAPPRVPRRLLAYPVAGGRCTGRTGCRFCTVPSRIRLIGFRHLPVPCFAPGPARDLRVSTRFGGVSHALLEEPSG